MVTGSVKRIVWFFGVSLLNLLDCYVYWVINGFALEYDIVTALFWVLLTVIPLFFFKDDTMVLWK